MASRRLLNPNTLKTRLMKKWIRWLWLQSIREFLKIYCYRLLKKQQLRCLGADRVKKARIQTLKAEFEFLIMKDTELIDDLYIKLNGIVTNVRALGEPVENAYMMKKLLRVVPEKFLQITLTIEQFGNLDGDDY